MKITVLASALALSLSSAAVSAAQVQPQPTAMLDYNGSTVSARFDYGSIVYIDVKPSLKGLVTPGDAAFSGDITWHGKAEGTAYTFRTGCPMAPYTVKGGYDPSIPGYVMKGKSPVRAKNGCEIVGYTADSPNARLVFVDQAEKQRHLKATPLSREEQAVYDEESGPDYFKGFTDNQN